MTRSLTILGLILGVLIVFGCSTEVTTDEPPEVTPRNFVWKPDPTATPEPRPTWTPRMKKLMDERASLERATATPTPVPLFPEDEYYAFAMLLRETFEPKRQWRSQLEEVGFFLGVAGFARKCETQALINYFVSFDPTVVFRSGNVSRLDGGAYPARVDAGVPTVGLSDFSFSLYCIDIN